MNEIIQSLKDLTENLSIQKDDKEGILEKLAILKSDTYYRMCEDFTTEDIISFLKSLSILQNKVKIILSSKAVAKIHDKKLKTKLALNFIELYDLNGDDIVYLEENIFDNQWHTICPYCKKMQDVTEFTVNTDDADIPYDVRFQLSSFGLIKNYLNAAKEKNLNKVIDKLYGKCQCENCRGNFIVMDGMREYHMNQRGRILPTQAMIDALVEEADKCGQTRQYSFIDILLTTSYVWQKRINDNKSNYNELNILELLNRHSYEPARTIDILLLKQPIFEKEGDLRGVLLNLVAIANSYAQIGRTNISLQYISKIEELEPKVSLNDKDRELFRNNLSYLYLQTPGKEEMGLTGFAELITEALKRGGDNYSDLKNYHGYLADYYTNKNDFAGSIPHYKEIVRLTEEQYGENDEIVADELEPLADAYKKLGDKKNAASVAERIRSIHSK